MPYYSNFELFQLNSNDFKQFQSICYIQYAYKGHKHTLKENLMPIDKKFFNERKKLVYV